VRIKWKLGGLVRGSLDYHRSSAKEQEGEYGPTRYLEGEKKNRKLS